jgi:AMMECR1 domain-containing protein
MAGGFILYTNVCKYFIMYKGGFFLFLALVFLASCGYHGKENFLAGWNDPSYKKLQKTYDKKRQKEIIQSARSSIFKFWNDAEPPDIPPLGSNEGLAIRLLVQGKDRGCLTWYKNSGDMNLFAAYCAVQALRDPRYEPVSPEEAENTFLELSIFGDWEDMQSPLEFIPGYHNLWLYNSARNTILQASLASQRNYTKEDFLEFICKKGELDKNDWKENTTLQWKRSPGLWLIEPLINN